MTAIWSHLNLVLESESVTESFTEHSNIFILILSSDNDLELLHEVFCYLQAIINISDISFLWLSCSTLNNICYNYLEVLSLSTLLRFRYFFTLDLYKCALLLSCLLNIIIKIIHFLSLFNCALSIIEDCSYNDIYEILYSLIFTLTVLNIIYHFIINNVNFKVNRNVN